MIKEYLLIRDTLFPMVPDGTEEDLDSKVWNVYRGNELVGMITTQQFQPVVLEFEQLMGMRVYLADKEKENGEVIDIYKLASFGDEIEEYDFSLEPKEEDMLTETMHIQEALPDERIMGEANALQQIAEEKRHQHDIIQEAIQTPPLIESLSEQYESVHDVTAIFGQSIEDVISFLQEEGEIVGMDSIVGIHEENNQRCIVMHESVEHRTERERVEEELRQAALGKLSKEEKRALGIK